MGLQMGINRAKKLSMTVRFRIEKSVTEKDN
jgi:hypothetical protein